MLVTSLMGKHGSSLASCSEDQNLKYSSVLRVASFLERMSPGRFARCRAARASSPRSFRIMRQPESTGKRVGPCILVFSGGSW